MAGIGLINMNGRLYDATIGRFISADPFIQAPLLSQSYNRYSYVLNNPLKLVDPSGYFFGFLKKIYKKVKRIVKKVASIINDVVVKAVKFVKKYWRPIAAITVAVVASFALPAAIPLVVKGAIAGGLGGFVSTGSLKGALIGAATGAAFAGVGQALGKLSVDSGLVNTRFVGSINRTVVTGLNTAGRVVKTLAHGAIGGLSSVAKGGKFMRGFLSAGVTAGFSPTIAAKLPYDNQQIARIVAGGTLGGATSAIAGGKFGDGFVTGAYSTWFNQEGGTALQRGIDRVRGFFREVWEGVKWRANAVTSGIRDDYAHGGISEVAIGATGGRTDESFLRQWHDNYKSTSVVYDLDKKATGVLVGGAAAQRYGGYTIGQYILNGPATHIGNHAATLRLVAATTVTNSIAIGSFYEIGNGVGSFGRTLVNRSLRAIEE